MQTGRFLDIPVVKIDQEFQDLIPLMVKEERDALEASILAHGCRDSIIVWNDLIIDGHRRYEICQKHSIDFSRLHMHFQSRDEAKIWIINNQFARRNLTPKQISYLRGIRQKIEKGENVGSADKLAKEYGVSARTIERDEKFAEAVNQLPTEEKQEVLIGKKKMTKGGLIGSPRVPLSPLEQMKKWWRIASAEEKAEFRSWMKHE